jgi:hypothetical protein
MTNITEISWDNVDKIVATVRSLREYPGMRESTLNAHRKAIPRFKEWLPKVLELEGSPIEDTWKKDLEPYLPTVISNPTLL